MKYYLAIDIGASSGRHMLGWLEDGKMACEEIHRFPNGMIKKDHELCWDLDALYDEIIYGLKRCAELGKKPESVGIDTWGVDFVLLDGDGAVVGNTVAYRDARTDGMDKEVYKHIHENEIYYRTGIQKQLFNTIYQLMAIKKDARKHLSKAKRLLLIPDYLHYRLSGIAKTEYTNATTTGLVNAVSKTWDDTILSACGYRMKLFANIVPPGTVLGGLTADVQKLVGFNCKVVLPATHDTASAVMAVPSTEEKTLYISSGTWSLMGVERRSPDCSIVSMSSNFSNEGGYEYRYRYLKNIMGLWMIQSLKKELGDKYTFAELCEKAAKQHIASLVDCNDSRFLAPDSMVFEVQQACVETGQQIPQESGELAAVIYNSLAKCYQISVKELEQIANTKYSTIHIVGGGSNAEYLNRLTAAYTGKDVYAGPSEATAIGNIMAQMIADGRFPNLQTARECIKRSFEIATHKSF